MEVPPRANIFYCAMIPIQLRSPLAIVTFRPPQSRVLRPKPKEMIMAWTTPTLVEICVGLEINGYLPAEF
jgi:coenzyme PQQ precursor peptide PqqA